MTPDQPDSIDMLSCICDRDHVSQLGIAVSAPDIRAQRLGKYVDRKIYDVEIPVVAGNLRLIQ